MPVGALLVGLPQMPALVYLSTIASVNLVAKAIAHLQEAGKGSRRRAPDSLPRAADKLPAVDPRHLAGKAGAFFTGEKKAESGHLFRRADPAARNPRDVRAEDRAQLALHA